MHKRSFLLLQCCIIMLCSTAAHSQWIKSTNIGSLVMEFARDGNNIYAGLIQDGVLLSTDNGVTWMERNIGVADSMIFSISAQGNRVYAGTTNGLFRSTNAGLLWNKVNGGWDDTLFQAVALRDSIIFALSQTGAYRSVDSGSTWMPMVTGILDPREYKSLFIGDSISFIGTDKSLYRSTDYGLQWSVADSGLAENYGVFSIVQTDSYFVIGTFHGIYRSSDAGVSWTEIQFGIMPTNIEGIARSEKNIFAAVTGYGVYVSTNNGANWSAVNAGLEDLVTISIVVSGPTVIVGGVQGIWIRPVDDMVTSVHQWTNTTPSAFRVEQNFPNPFNPSTSIRYFVPANGSITLKVFDVMGREISSLVDGNVDAGWHTATFNAENRSSGIYFYRLQSGSFTKTNTMILMK